LTELDIRERFELEMLRIYREATAFNYYPRIFLQMVGDRGGVATAKYLLNTEQPSSGYVRLWQADRLDLSVEAVALQAPWWSLFTEDELETARQRLRAYNYVP
jgi:hypothetical protein